MAAAQDLIAVLGATYFHDDISGVLLNLCFGTKLCTKTRNYTDIFATFPMHLHTAYFYE